jgi:phenylacetate-CoA ligase
MMINVYNPKLFLKIIKSYLLDINRLKNFSEEELKKFQVKELKKIISYANTVALYRNKFKKAEVGHCDIYEMEDIVNLPIITKEDIREYYPNGIISDKVRMENLIEINTSGTTGKKLSIFGDPLDMFLWFYWYIRILREYGINWWRKKLTIIGDLSLGTIGSSYINQTLFFNSNYKKLFKNMQFLDTNEDPKKIIREINSFKPDFIGGYVGMLSHLALIKFNGGGEQIRPSFIATIGSVLTSPLKKLLEETFNAKVFEVYGTTETGTIAFQCTQGSYHVMSDLVFPEFYRNGKRAESKEPGKMIITRLYGKGTPIIRYNAINDIVAPLQKKCKCGVPGMLIHKIYGRDTLALYLSKGRVLLPSSITEIHSRVLYELKTNRVKHTRIIQDDIDTINIDLILDKKSFVSDSTDQEIFSIIKKGYEEKIGKNVSVNIKKVKKVDMNGARIITKVDKSNFKIKKYI